MRRSAGFTLVELLVAIAILAMVAVLGWRGLDGIVRARVALTDQMEMTRGMQLAFAQMQSDCEHAADTELLGRRPFLQYDNNRLTLVRTVFNENEPARLQVVSYRLVNRQLVRRESLATRDLLVLDAQWQAALTDLDPTAPVILQDGVDSMALLGWKNNAWLPQSDSDSQSTSQSQSQSQSQSSSTAQNTNTNTNTNTAITGVQVALTARGYPQPLLKSFLLGSI